MAGKHLPAPRRGPELQGGHNRGDVSRTKGEVDHGDLPVTGTPSDEVAA